MRKQPLEVPIVADERERVDIASSRRTLCRVFAIAALCGVAVFGVFLGLFDGIFYLVGLFNSSLAYGLGPFLLPVILAGGVYLPIRLVGGVLRRSGCSGKRTRYVVFATMAVSAVLSWLGLGLTGLGSRFGSPFLSGLARYVERRADIPAVQDWLGTLDPRDCEGQRLGDKIAPSQTFPDPPKYVPVPPALAGFAGLRGHGIILSKDDEGRPMVRVFLGGGGPIGIWGATVGPRDMPVPPSDFSEHGEERLALAPGAYVWFSE